MSAQGNSLLSALRRSSPVAAGGPAWGPGQIKTRGGEWNDQSEHPEGRARAEAAHHRHRHRRRRGERRQQHDPVEFDRLRICRLQHRCPGAAAIRRAAQDPARGRRDARPRRRGATGTGAAPVIARVARESGILTVGVVTKPFHFEGVHRMRIADSGIEELQKFVDTLIIIPNQNLFRIANERTTFADAFKMADDVLHSGVRGVTDLMVMPGLINLDFADIRTVMAEMGKAMMGTGEAEGERRAIEAAESAISNPLLEDVSMKGARGILINITV